MMKSITNKQVDITIGMPVFNDKIFIEKSIQSILNQSFEKFILIISDDCSSDGSSEICLKYAALDNRVKYIRQSQNIGISNNMKLLLDMSKSKYFMWAADDDLWDKNFIKTLFDVLESNQNIVSAFCTYVYIDEVDRTVSNVINIDYNSNTAFGRLIKFIKTNNDAIGYGLFRREKIKNIQFPIWWWPNKKCAYNNIYPAICYFLTKGNCFLVKGNPLWFNRLKSSDRINHLLPYQEKVIRGYLAFSIRKLNLFLFSAKLIFFAQYNIILYVRIFPFLCYYWFFLPTLNNLKHIILKKYEKAKKN